MKSYGGFLMLSISLFFILIGLHNGEASYVLSKAIMICMECIGLG